MRFLAIIAALVFFLSACSQTGDSPLDAGYGNDHSKKYNDIENSFPGGEE